MNTHKSWVFKTASFQSSVGTNTANNIDLKNHENIKELYQQLCHHYRPIIDIIHPTAKFPDISLIVTINYDSVFKVIPLVEVRLQLKLQFAPICIQKLLYLNHSIQFQFCRSCTGHSSETFTTALQRQASKDWNSLTALKKKDGTWHFFILTHIPTLVRSGGGC